MIVVLCIDDRSGMMFNHRRQSKDQILQKHVMALCKGEKLYMNEYSYNMFAAIDAQNVIIDNEFIRKAGTGDYCFIEDISPMAYEENIEKIILYKWNRSYPADLYFDIPLDKRWKLIDMEEFKGSSHGKITQEVYTR